MKDSPSDLVNIERAIAKCHQQLAVDPQTAEIYLRLGSLYARQEQWQQAIANYRKAIAIESDFAEAHRHLAATMKQSGNPDLAANHLFEAFQLQPDSVTAQEHYELGQILQTQDKPARAIACYRAAIELQPDLKNAYDNLAQLLVQQGKPQRAIETYRQGVRHNPQDYSYYLALASALAAEGKWVRACNNYQQAAELKPSAEIYYQLGKLLRSRSRFPEAIVAYCKAIELDPNFKNAYIDLQYTPTAPEQSAKLIEFYRQIVDRHPEITIAWGNLGDALTQQDRVAEAIDCYRTCSYHKAVQTYPHLAELDWQEPKKLAPDFIIAGASKCGTSSIYYYLSRHPQVLVSHTKEIDFFQSNYQRGIDWYLAHFPSITDRPDFLTGEATPNYLRFPQVAHRIKADCPQSKIIILLRNPVDRAISWHYHKLNTGLTSKDLATAIATEIERLSEVSEAEITNTGFYEPDNIMSSLYIYKIKPWIELLGREQFLILKSEDFYLDPLRTMTEVFEFLDLPNCPLNNYPKVNAGSYNRVDPGLRKTLAEYFAPYNRQLEEYLGMNFGWE